MNFALKMKNFMYFKGDRWRTLMSVDDIVGAVVATLEKEKLIDR